MKNLIKKFLILSIIIKDKMIFDMDGANRKQRRKFAM